MKLITAAQRAKLLANGKARRDRMAQGHPSIDHKPVVKLFCPWGSATWLLSELDPELSDIAFGLCDLGGGCPELGMVDLRELAALRGPWGLRVERDKSFDAEKTLTAYAAEARAAGRINA